MGFFLRLFTGNPVTMVYVALAIAGVSAAAGGTIGWKLNGWRLGAELAQAQRDRDVAIDQGKVLASSLESCNAGVKRVEELSGKALENMSKMVAAAQRLHQSGQAMVNELEERLKRAPAGQTCDDAWSELEKMRGP